MDVHMVTTTTPAIKTSSMDNFRRATAAFARPRTGSCARSRTAMQPSTAMSAMVRAMTKKPSMTNASTLFASPRRAHTYSEEMAQEMLTSEFASSGRCRFSMTGWSGMPNMVSGRGPWGAYSRSKVSRSSITGVVMPAKKSTEKPTQNTATKARTRSNPSLPAKDDHKPELLMASGAWMPSEAKVDTTQNNEKHVKPTSSCISDCSSIGWFNALMRYRRRM
mmetsp:Transcript_94394/g.264344  ORF Transcript_94394/g.264344 Transcript_94394/m.264344 type:complete len:221 (-) Transcript_94394:360-1022(-)